MTIKLDLDTVLSTFNKFGEPVEFYFHPDLTGCWSGLVVGGETYCKDWENFVKDYTEFAHLSPPLTFHEQNLEFDEDGYDEGGYDEDGYDEFGEKLYDCGPDYLVEVNTGWLWDS